MFKITEIRELIRLVDETGISELQVESAGAKLLIKKPELPVTYSHSVAAVLPDKPQMAQIQVPAVQKVIEQPAAQATQPAKEAKPNADDDSLVKIVSPMVGTFYSASAPGADSYVSVGQRVTEKTVVCIVEAMKLMNEIEADVRGEIVSILVENGQLVEYGQPMFLVKPE